MPGGTTDATERLLAFQREVNRLFRRFFEEASRDKRRPAAEGPAIPVDAFDRGDALVVEVEAPGIPAESLRLFVSRDLIIVEGEKPSASPGKVQYHCLEREFGAFRKIIEIPAPINAGAIEAVYESGVLRITAPKIVEDRRGARRPVEIRFVEDPQPPTREG